MANSTFLCKEINFTKTGKAGKNGINKNSYVQLLKSIKHSLRIEMEEKNIHIIDAKTHENIIYTHEKTFSNNKEIIELIEKEIAENIKKYENIDDKENRLKILKQFQDAKSAIAKKTDIKTLDKFLDDNLDTTELLKKLNLVNDKRTLKTLENYIKLKKERDEIKTETRAYQNQTLVKEIIFKIPEGQSLNIKNEDWITLQNNFLNNYFKEYKLHFSAIHCDEGTENKSYLHMFLSGFNHIKNDFDINEKIFNDMNKKYDLNLDYNKGEDHKIAMRKFQEDFYNFFNKELKLLNYKDKIELKTYTTEDEIKKRLKIKKEDNLTITQKHTKLINQKINEKLEKMEGEKPKILKSEIKENSTFLSDKKTYKLELETETKEEMQKVLNGVNNYFNISNFVKDLEKEKQDANNKYYILKSDATNKINYLTSKEDELLLKVKKLQNELSDTLKYKNEIVKIEEKNKILKDVLEKNTHIKIYDSDIDSNLDNTITQKRNIKDEEDKKFIAEELKRIKDEREKLAKQEEAPQRHIKDEFEEFKRNRHK